MGVEILAVAQFHAYSIQELDADAGGRKQFVKNVPPVKVAHTIVARLVFRRIRDGLSACYFVPESSHFVASARDSRDGVTFVPTPEMPW